MAQLPQLHFHHLTVGKGLTQTPNEHICKDAEGYVWVSSMNGLNQYDGQVVRNHLPNPKKPGSLLDGFVQGPIFEDANSNIWLATFEGINCYDRRAATFRHYKPLPEPSYFNLGLDAHGRLWFLHGLRQICTLDTRTGSFTARHRVNEDTHGGLLVPGPNGKPTALVSYSRSVPGVQLSWYGPDEQLLRQAAYLGHGPGPGQLVSDAVLAPDGHAWLSTDAGLVRFNPAAPESSMQQFPFGKKAHLTGIAILPDGQLACATDTDGLWFFDPKAGAFIGALRHVPDAHNTLASNELEAVDIDRDGVLWVSIRNWGVDYASIHKNKFRPVPMPTGAFAEGGPAKYGELLEDSQGRTWCILDGGGLLVFDKDLRSMGRYTSKARPPYRLTSNRSYHIFEDRSGRIWLMSQGGLLVLLPGERNFLVADRSDAYLHGLQLADGRLLFSRFTGGVWELAESGSDGPFELKPVEGPTANGAWLLLHEDSQRRLWGSRDLVAVQVFSLRKNGSYQPLSEVAVSGEVAGFYEDKQNKKIWVAASSGLHSLAEGSFLPKEEALPNLAIASMLPDGLGNLWLGTNRGIWQARLTDGHLRQFSAADGVSSLESGFQSLLRRSDGSFLFGNASGLVRCGAGDIRAVPSLAVPQLTDLTANGTPLGGASGTAEAGLPSAMQAICLRHNENLLGFTLTALEYSDPESCRIRYILHGADRDTVQVPSGTSVRYPNLPHGTYRLEAWAANSDGVWNPKPLELTARIMPAFWQTWWFKLLCLVAFVGMVYLFFWVRDQERQRTQQLRDRLSRDLHDELGSTLSSISILSESAKHSRARGHQGLSLEQIGQRAREAMESVSDMVWAIKPQNDPMPAVLRRMRLFAAETLEPLGMSVRFRVDDAVQALALPSEHRKELYLIFKEAVNNCAKYSRAQNVAVELAKQGNRLTMSIADDGTGFDTAELQAGDGMRQGGNGLRNMQARAEALRATFSIKSALEEGTTIQLEVPLP